MRKGIRLIAALVFLAILINASYQILSWKDTSGPYMSSTQQLYYTQDNLMDVVFVGSSHCYSGVYPEVIWEACGYSGFDMAVSGQDKNSACHAIIEVCKTQHPQVIFVDVFSLLYERHAVQGNEYRNMLAFKTSVNSVKLVMDYAEEEKQLEYILRWPIIHTRYRELQKYDFVDYEPSNFGRGAHFSWNVGYAEKPYMPGYTESAALSESNLAWLEELQQLSEEYGFALVMMQLPCNLTEPEQQILNGAADYLREQNIPFLEFNCMAEQVGLDYTKDFEDSGHLNAYGAEKISLFLGDYLKENYSLEDHRGDADYDVWEESTQYYRQLKQEQYLAQIHDMQEWTAQIKRMENITLVFSLDGNYAETQVDLPGLLKQFGISEEEFYAGGKWVVTSDGIQAYLSNDSRTSLLWDLGDDTLKIVNGFMEDGSPAGSSILLGREEYRILEDGLNILVYDEFQKKLLEWRGFYQ